MGSFLLSTIHIMCEIILHLFWIQLKSLSVHFPVPFPLLPSQKQLQPWRQEWVRLEYFLYFNYKLMYRLEMQYFTFFYTWHLILSFCNLIFPQSCVFILYVEACKSGLFILLTRCLYFFLYTYHSWLTFAFMRNVKAVSDVHPFQWGCSSRPHVLTGQYGQVSLGFFI